MSTRASILYWPRPLHIHLYVELLDQLIYLEVGENYGWHVPVWPTRRWLSERLPWSLGCRLGWHLWCLSEMPQRTTQRADGRWNLSGNWVHECLRCDAKYVRAPFTRISKPDPKAPSSQSEESR